MAAATLEEPSLFNWLTVTALGAMAAIFATACVFAFRSLPANTSGKMRAFYIWHVTDGLTHCIIEFSFLYNCFFSYTQHAVPTSDWPHPASLGANPNPPFLGRADRSYGPNHANNVFALMWQEYAKADKRWGGADLTVISLELLTVFIAGPLAFYVAELIRRGGGSSNGGAQSAKLWFWGSMLACGELYGGFMTFAPEWLSGNSNLATDNFIKLWVYLVFFNMAWVFMPFWFLYESYVQIRNSFVASATKVSGKKKA